MFSNLNLSFILLSSSSLNSLAIEPDISLFSNFINPSDEAPSSLYSLSNFLNHEFDLSHESNFIHLTSLSLNTTDSLFLSIEVKFSISNLILKSGLSLPYFSIASLYGILLNGIGLTSLFPNFLNTS